MSGCRLDSPTTDLADVYYSRIDHETGKQRMSGETNIQHIGEFVVRGRYPEGTTLPSPPGGASRKIP